MNRLILSFCLLLAATAVQAEELDGVMKLAEALPGVRQAFWNASDES